MRLCGDRVTVFFRENQNPEVLFETKEETSNKLMGIEH